MEHYQEAERLLEVGLINPAIVHALLALVDVLRSDDCDCAEDYRIDPSVMAEFLRPIKDADIKDGLL